MIVSELEQSYSNLVMLKSSLKEIKASIISDFERKVTSGYFKEENETHFKIHSEFNFF